MNTDRLKRHLSSFGFSYVLFILCCLLLLLTQFNASPYTILRVSLRQAGVLGILAIGLSFVVLTGGLDLSCGAILSLSGGLSAALIIEFQLPLWLAFLCSILLSGACGLLNGLLIIKLKIHSAIVTVATMLLYSGGTMFLGQNFGILGLPRNFLNWGRTVFLGIPSLAWIWFLLFGVAALMLRYTYYGRFLYALGDSRKALETMAINVPRYRILAYVLCGMFAGISGILMLSRVGISTSNINIPLVFDGMIAITLGGVSLRGGRGNIAGVMLGICNITLLSICMISYSFTDYAQYMIKVAIFFIAIFIDNRTSKR